MKLWKWILSCMALTTGSCQCAAFTSVDVDTFGKLITNDSVQIVDVRTAEEFASGHIRGAINIDMKSADFVEQSLSLLDLKRPVAVYCRSGKRSKVAAQQLEEQGFLVSELDNGIVGWVSQGHPIE